MRSRGAFALLGVLCTCLLAGSTLGAPEPDGLQGLDPWSEAFEQALPHQGVGSSRSLQTASHGGAGPAKSLGSGRQLKGAATLPPRRVGRPTTGGALAAAAAAAALRRAAAFFDAGSVPEEAEVIMPVPVALPPGFQFESAQVNPDGSPAGGPGFEELFAKVPHAGFGGGSAGLQRAASSADTQDVLESGQPDKAQPDGKGKDMDKQQQDAGKKQGDAKKASGGKPSDGKKADSSKPSGGEQPKKDNKPGASDSSSSSSGAEDGMFAAIPSAAVMEAQRQKEATQQPPAAAPAASASSAAPLAASDGSDSVSLIPTDPTAPHPLPYAGAAATPPLPAGLIPSKMASLAAAKERSSRMEAGQQQAAGKQQQLPAAAVAGIVIGVLVGVGCCLAVVLTRRARRAKAAAAADVAAGRKQMSSRKPVVASESGSDNDSEDVEYAETGAAPLSRGVAGPPKALRR